MAISILITVDSVQYNVTNDVLKDSLKLSYSLFKELEPTTNKVDLKLSRASTLLPLILATTNDVIVEVKDGSTYLFKGYLTDNYSWQITNRGQQPVSISAEDPGIRLLKKNWVSSNSLYTLYSNLKICDKADQTNSIIHKISSLAGVVVSSAIPTISSTLSLNVQDKDNPTYWDILKQITFEYGHVFYFENDGEFSLYPIAKSSITPTTTFSTTTNILAETDNKGIDIQKKPISYKQVNLTWDEWENKTDIYVFRDSTGGDNVYDCNIPLAAGAYYPTGADASTYVYSDYKAETGQDIINVTTATLDYVVDAGITVEFENLGTRGKLRIHNTSGSTADIRKLKVKANSVILKKNTNVVKAGTNTTPIYKYTAKYIHDLTTANNLANTLKDHYAYSNYTYSFKSLLNIDLGLVVTLHDTMWSTVNEPVLLISKEAKENGVISYTAVGVDVFDLFAVTSRDITIPGDINNATIYNPQLLSPTITVGTTTVDLGGSTGALGNVDISGTADVRELIISSLTAGDTYVIKQDLDEISYNTTSDGQIFWPKSLQICASGVVTVVFSAQGNASTTPSYAQIYVDGVAAGTRRTIDATYRTWSENIPLVSIGSIIQIRLYSGKSGWIVRAKDLYIKSSEKPGILTYLGIANDSGITIASPSISVTQDESTNATRYPLFSPAYSGAGTLRADSIFTYNPSTGNLSTSIFSGTTLNLSNQQVAQYTIPGSTNKILQLKNTATGQTDGDVFAIFEIRSPDTASTESTLSQHNVVSGTDDWVRDVSFHNYSSTMKAVDVISHFTGTTAGNWQWVSRYTTGTNYDMVDRNLLTLEGDTGNLKLGEDATISSTARGKLDVRNKGWTTTPSILASIDSSHSSQPSALIAQNGNNYAYAGNLTTLKLLNASDTGTVLKLENAGTGNYITADSAFSVAKDGKIMSDSLTASTLIGSDASKKIVSLPTDTYPSLTELSYVKGTTSEIQSQINSKEGDLGNPTGDFYVLVSTTEGNRTWADIGYTGSQGGAGYTGSFGYTGSRGLTGYTGSFGLTGNQGATGYTGSFGLTGTVGNTGYTGSRGLTGYNGSFGLTGTTGTTGYNGSVGLTGAVGYTGSFGLTGNIGATGYNGSRGNDGLTGYTGSFGLTGSQGTTGYNGSFGTTGSVGATGFTGSRGLTGYNGSFGATGNVGGTGYTGSQGLIGSTGVTGYNGSRGLDGAIGYTGSFGLTGTQGTTGYNGSFGATGSGGATGFTGSRGTTGYNGSFGLTGSQGGTGYTGSFGLTGNIGTTGNIGGTGYTGSQGLTGSIGTTGYNGSFGSTGGVGGTGFTGSRGLTGYNGSFGLTGSQGGTGYTGSMGLTGSTGSTGYNGSFGLTGSQGGTGYTGSFGTTGSGGGTGYTGSFGATGSNGAIGYTGSFGLTGSGGATGYTGSFGSTGSGGATGYTGSFGIGYTGSMGATGPGTSINATANTNNTSYVVGVTAAGGSTPYIAVTAPFSFNPSTGAVTAFSFNASSLRALKENIVDYKDEALSLLDKISVVSFNYKNDMSKEKRIGFIADESPEEVAGSGFNKMDIGNTVGLLIKAVQELKIENEELKKAIKNG
jgi:hypothetical protein